MNKKKILAQIPINTDMFLTSFEKASVLLLDKKQELEDKGWSNIHLKIDECYDWAELNAYGLRDETDEEYNIRVSKEEKKLMAQKKKEERERAKYKELKEKFEKN